MGKPVTLRKVGNSATVTIPRELIHKLGWRITDVLHSSIRGDALLLQRMRPPEPLLSVPDEKFTGGSR